MSLALPPNAIYAADVLGVSGNPDLSFPAFLVNNVLQFRFNKLTVIVCIRFSFSPTITGTNKNMRDVR
jgi:hypothetical protein